jgi:3'(2'), 5'-bisphosphate nucleotidase
MSNYAAEKRFGLSAVRRACALTNSVFNKLVKGETLVKGDKSPVTVGDYAAQALVCSMLRHAFPEDLVVGEEDSADLRLESASEMRGRIINLANEAVCAPLQDGDDAAWGIGPGARRSSEELLDAIDRGNHNGGKTGRMWTLDPIDGTKGFLRGEQYAVCLSLIIDAKVVLGVIGCPNLRLDPAQPESPKGCIFVAVKGQGAEQYTLDGTSPKRILIPQITTSDLSFLESVEAAHSSHEFNARVSELLRITKDPVRMDSQAKYCCLARGEGGAYLRMPTGVGYSEKIWDHAPGHVLVEEAGGIISDSRGQRLDFGLGRTLGENYGVIAAGKSVHGDILSAVKTAWAEEAEKKHSGKF